MWDKIKRFLFATVYEVITWVWIGLSIGAYFYNAGNKNASGLRLAEISLVVSVFAMCCFIAKRIFLDAEPEKKRPELYISGSMMGPLTPGEPETVLLGLKNRGNAIARNIRIGGGNHQFTTSNFSGPLEFKRVDVSTCADLGPGPEEDTLLSRSPQPLTERQIRELQEGQTLFFHYAEGEYDDDAGNTYPIDYCYMFNPQSPTVMRICPEKYWPRDRAKRKWPPRPHLVVQSAGVNLKAGERLDMAVAFTNDGDADTTKLEMSGITTVVDKSFKGPLTRKGMTTQQIPIDVTVGRTITAVLRESRRWAKEGIDAIENGDALLFHFGRADYADARGNTYWIEFCLRYEPGMPLSPSGLHYMAVADKSFWPTDNESQSARATSTQNEPRISRRTTSQTVDVESSVTPSIDVKVIRKGEQPQKKEELTPEELAGPPRMGAGSGARPGGYPPLPYSDIKWTDYREDYFYGAIWRWKYRPEMGDKEPRNIEGWCPECDSRPLRQRTEVRIEKDSKTRIATVYCGKHIEKTYYVRTPTNLALDGIRELIRERLQNGTWKDVVIQQRQAGSG